MSDVEVVVLKSMEDVQMICKDYYDQIAIFWRFWKEAGIIGRINFTAKTGQKKLIEKINVEVDGYVDRYFNWGINIFIDERPNTKEYHDAVIQWGKSKYYDGKHQSFFEHGMVRS